VGLSLHQALVGIPVGACCLWMIHFCNTDGGATLGKLWWVHCLLDLDRWLWVGEYLPQDDDQLDGPLSYSADGTC